MRKQKKLIRLRAALACATAAVLLSPILLKADVTVTGTTSGDGSGEPESYTGSISDGNISVTGGDGINGASGGYADPVSGYFNVTANGGYGGDADPPGVEYGGNGGDAWAEGYSSAYSNTVTAGATGGNGGGGGTGSGGEGGNASATANAIAFDSTGALANRVSPRR
jgi:hypothetical protein